MDIDSVSATNPNAGLVNTHNVNPANINALNPVSAPQPLSRPAPMHPSGAVANSAAYISNPGQLINADVALQMAALSLVLPRRSLRAIHPSLRHQPRTFHRVHITCRSPSSPRHKPLSPARLGARIYP